MHSAFFPQLTLTCLPIKSVLTVHLSKKKKRYLAQLHDYKKFKMRTEFLIKYLILEVRACFCAALLCLYDALASYLESTW